MCWRGCVLFVSLVAVLLREARKDRKIQITTSRTYASSTYRDRMDLATDFQSMRKNKDKIYKFHDAGSAYHDTNFTCPVKWVRILVHGAWKLMSHE